MALKKQMKVLFRNVLLILLSKYQIFTAKIHCVNETGTISTMDVHVCIWEYEMSQLSACTHVILGASVVDRIEHVCIVPVLNASLEFCFLKQQGNYIVDERNFYYSIKTTISKGH